MRKKHNKKRNTAFLYDVLVKELTKTIIDKDFKQKNVISTIIKEHFGGATALGKELLLYKTLLETTDLEPRLAEKLLNETKIARSQLDSKDIFDSQTAVINKINKTLSKESWNTFVPNFKSLASISAIFNGSSTIKQRVLYEDAVVNTMSNSAETKENHMKPIDNIVYRSFVKNYNEQYATLMKEQKELLSKYIASFADNGLQLKVYLNEEIGRLREVVEESLTFEEVFVDEQMVLKTKEVLDILEGFKESDPSEETISQVLKIQELVREIQSND